MVQQTCRNHRIHFFLITYDTAGLQCNVCMCRRTKLLFVLKWSKKYKPLRKYNSTNANESWVFQTKKILLGLCLIGLGPDSLVSRYIHAVTVKKSSRQNTLLVFFCKRRRVLLSFFFSFSLFPWGTREGKGKRGESSALPSPPSSTGKGGGRGLTCQGQCEQPCNLVSQTNWGHPFCHVLQLALESCLELY